MNRSTVVVGGPLAFRMRRISAARKGEAGLQIMTLPQLAARLAGGFIRPSRHQDLEPAIRSALDEGGFAEIEAIRSLPGMGRSVAWTLTKLWDADFDLSRCTNPRLKDLAAIEERVRQKLPAGVLAPRELRDAAQARVHHAPAVLGRIEIDGVAGIAPVWRGLFALVQRYVPVTWRNAGSSDPAWFAGTVVNEPLPEPASLQVVSCATPRAEVVEALRWLRELIATGGADPSEIAICATATEDWDEHMLALATEAGLPVHFSHGVPALASREGQACAALADVLLNGLSQDRVRRLFGHAIVRSRGLADLPSDWAFGMKREAALFELDQWRRALDAAHGRRTDGVDVRPRVLPVLELLARGADAVEPAGSALLSNEARAVWFEALRRAPARALEFSLREIRTPDGRDPGACAVWCPASHLVGAPRRFVRLLGMTTRSWPRRTGEDPLLPTHILDPGEIGIEPIGAVDRRAYDIIVRRAAGGVVLSRSRRNAQGNRLAASPLVPRDPKPVALGRVRIPSHAYSETDRLLARPGEAATSSALDGAMACWRNWGRAAVTAHDGRIRPDHPVVRRAIDLVQSATSLRLLLRDPIAFVWRYALGWRSVEEEEQPLSLDPRAYGELVHQMLKRAVDALEPNPGFVRAARHEIEAALNGASSAIEQEWPLERSAPPTLLWRHTLDVARGLALKALTLDVAFQPSTRSWTELAFGREDGGSGYPADLLWPPAAPVVIPGTNVSIRGNIDRVDYNKARNGIRLSDYKTGAIPKKVEDIVLARGAELQRVLYTIATLQLVPDNPRVIARLIYLTGKEPTPYELVDADRAIADIGRYVSLAIDLLRRGMALPGPDAHEGRNNFRICLPAARDTYFQVKGAALSRAFGNMAEIWRAR